MTQSQEKKLVLVVDDDRQVQDLVEDVLKKTGYHPVSASDGKRALDLVKMCPPDLLILDMGLPFAGGFEVLKALQNDEYRHIPILLMSGQPKDESLIVMLKKEPNVYGFLVKPLRVGILLDAIKAAMSGKKTM